MSSRAPHVRSHLSAPCLTDFWVSYQGLAKLRMEEQSLPGELKLVTPTRDFTPPQFLTLLFTDLGVLTPSAVSDELIKLYY